MSQTSLLDKYPKITGIVTWLTASARRSAFEKVTSSEGCGWITESLSRCNWMDIATWFILISYAVRLPFFVRYLMNCRKEPAAKVACAHAEGKFSCYCYPLAAVIGKLTMLYFANTNALPAWSQISPQFDLVAKIGTALGGLSLLLLLWGHFSLSSSWSHSVLAQKNQKLRLDGAYRYARHPLYMVYALQAVAVLLISQNLLLGAACVPWVLHCFAKVRQEETLLIELFGQKYVDYMKAVPAFGPLARRLFKRDFGLTDSEQQAALKMHQEKLKKAGDAPSSSAGKTD
jgi:protein-S-isoprenylcysteine O-methyltransferase Ste14